MLNETMLSAKDSIQLLTPPGYKVVVRQDRDRNGGGLVVFAEDFRLVNTVDVKKYNYVGTAEIICINYLGHFVALCYTQKSATAGVLFDSLERFRVDYPEVQMTVLGDFNMQQLVNVPTRGDNTLDLVFSDTRGSFEPCPHLGTSDHISMMVTIPVDMPTPPPPPGRMVYMWKSAPWNHMNGYLRRKLKGWRADDYESVDDADRALNLIQLETIKKYVKQRALRKPKPTPWWDAACQNAYVAKIKAFKRNAVDPGKYSRAKRSCKRAEARAFKC
jgi:hypothetical protein